MQKNIRNIPKIRVIIRKRPLSKKEFGHGQKDIIEIPNSQTILVKQEKVKVDLTPYLDQYKFIFDGAFNQSVSNEQIYVSMVRPLIDAAFDGAKVSCFAYGQTGSGKTYTMLGDGKNINGLYLLAAKDVFEMKNSFQDVSIWVSFYEIYCGKLYDLLNDRNILHARQDAKNNINIVGLSERKAQNINEVMKSIEYGTSIRVTAQNSTNVDSSRSHAILQLTLRKSKKVHGKVSFIDLAGSERAADHADQTDKQTRIDGAQINKSLLALKECIRALDQNKHHTPFRGSKLTMVLKDSFVGYCKTVMIANVSPNSSSCQNTLNTLKYADRVKELKKSQNLDKLPEDYLNDLSRELMLPRQLVNHHQISRNQKPRHSESEHMLMKNNYLHDDVQVQPKDKFKNNQSSLDQKHGPNQLKIDLSLKPTRQRRSNSSMNPNSLNKLSYESDQEVYERLNQRHEEMLAKVIEGEETLITEHDKYINSSVQSAREHIELMNQADKVGSSIQNYLNKLDTVLEREMQEIYRMKALVENLKYNLDQSKKIENLYVEINNRTMANHLQGNSSMISNPINHGRPNNFHPHSQLGSLNFQYNQSYGGQASNSNYKNQKMEVDMDNGEPLLFD